MDECAGGGGRGARKRCVYGVFFSELVLIGLYNQGAVCSEGDVCWEEG